jgi:hypothetical protein
MQHRAKRSPLGQRKWPYKTGELLKKRFNSYQIFYDKTRKGDL